jgi:biotin carboxyl carrier protein
VEFKIQIDGAAHQIEANPNGTVSFGGETFEAKVGRPSDDRRMIQLGDKSYEVRIVESCADTGVFVLEIAGERIPLSVTDVSKSVGTMGVNGAAGAAGPGGASAEATAVAGTGGEAAAKVPEEVREGVWAPVPGKIVDVLVKARDRVEEGTPVVILEAMKMENELHAPKTGTVTAVLVKKGDQAEKGQLLVAFE